MPGHKWARLQVGMELELEPRHRSVYWFSELVCCKSILVWD